MRRARLAVLAAVVLAAILIATEVPVGQLLSTRSASSGAAAELAKVRRENAALAHEVAGLKKGSTIEQIAHKEYGLVMPGQRSVVVMPSSTGSSGSSPLNSHTVPLSALVPSDQSLDPPASRKQTAHKSFFGRVLRRLEFWRS